MRFFRSLNDDELWWFFALWTVVCGAVGFVLGHVLR